MTPCDLEQLLKRIERLEGRLALMSDSNGNLLACARDEAGCLGITGTVDAFARSGCDAAEVVDLLGYSVSSWQSHVIRQGFLWRTRRTRRAQCADDEERRYWIVRKPA